MFCGRYRNVRYRNRLVEALFSGLCDLHAAGGIEYRLDDVMIAGAAADIALELLAQRHLIEVRSMAFDDVDRGHDHAGSTVTALQSVIVTEGGLHRMQFVALCDALDGGDAGAVGLSHQYRAGFDGPSVDMNRAGAALAGIAADVGSRQSQMIAQQMHKQRSVFDLGRNLLAIDRQFYAGHARSSPN